MREKFPKQFGVVFARQADFLGVCVSARQREKKLGCVFSRESAKKKLRRIFARQREKKFSTILHEFYIYTEGVSGGRGGGDVWGGWEGVCGENRVRSE